MDETERQDAKDRRAGITLRELEVLQALVQVGTTSNAALRLNISQSAVSRRLSQLEERLQFKLFVRENSRLTPTADAIAINEQLKSVFETLSQITRRASQPFESLKGPLSIAAPPTIAHRFLPSLIADFKRLNPDLKISFDILASDALIARIAEGRVDIGITDSTVAHDGIQTQLLLETQAICIFPKDHHFASYDLIQPKDLEGVPFITLSRRHSSRAIIDRVFERAGIEANEVLEASTNISVAEFVRQGLGVSLLNPFPLEHQFGDQLAMRPFLPVIEYRASFLLPASRPPSTATLAFMNAAREEVERAFDPSPLTHPKQERNT